MRKTLSVLFIFFLPFILCSCSEKIEKAEDWLGKAQALWNGERYTDPGKAVRYFNKAIELQPLNAETYNKRATAYYNLGDFQRTIEDTTEAIRLRPDLVSAYYNRGNAHASLSRYQEAIEDYTTVLGMRKNASDIYNNRGLLYLLQGKMEQGCRDLKTACGLNNCVRLEEAKFKGYCR